MTQTPNYVPIPITFPQTETKEPDAVEDLMKKLWEPTLHFEKGICYTFDPKLHGKFQVNPERLLRAHIDFDVGELFSVCIYFS